MEFVWTYFIKYIVLNIVYMTFCLLYSASAMRCVIGLTRLYYPNVIVIYIRNLLLIIVCSKMYNHWYVHHWCMHVCCAYFNKLNWIDIKQQLHLWWPSISHKLIAFRNLRTKKSSSPVTNPKFQKNRYSIQMVKIWCSQNIRVLHYWKRL